VILMASGTIRNRVSELMGRNRMSIADVMRETGLSYQTVWALYHDKTSRIEFKTLLRLCEVFNAQVGDIFEYIPSSEGDR
jgi:putative transcriptional regulator